jgi:thymidine kinase
MSEKKFKQVCKCEHCGSEAEMVITCTLEEDLPQEAVPAVVSEAEGKTKGHSICSHCGNEADIWLDL